MSKKRIITFGAIGFIVFVSCGRVNNKSDVKTNESIIVDTAIATYKLEKINFSKTVFEKGEAYHFTDSCTLQLECDCCSGKIIFNEDSTFYEISYCVENDGVALGHYNVSGSSLILMYSGLYASTEYNEAYETNSSLPEYFEKDSVFSASTERYSISFCNNKIKATGEDQKEIAIVAEDSYKESLIALEKQNYIKRLKKINKSR